MNAKEILKSKNLPYKKVHDKYETKAYQEYISLERMNL